MKTLITNWKSKQKQQKQLVKQYTGLYFLPLDGLNNCSQFKKKKKRQGHDFTVYNK